jgi:hypothetical protein
MLAAFAALLAKTAAEEGRDIVLVMLVVGLVIVGVAVLGDVNNWLRRRRRPH